MNFIRRIVYKLAERYLDNNTISTIIHARNRATQKIEEQIKNKSEKEMEAFLVSKGDGFTNLLENQNHRGYLVQGLSHHKVVDQEPNNFKV
jgi:hypothetical protein